MLKRKSKVLIFFFFFFMQLAVVLMHADKLSSTLQYTQVML